MVETMRNWPTPEVPASEPKPESEPRESVREGAQAQVPFISQPEFAKVARALLEGNVSEEELRAHPGKLGMSKKKMEAALEWVRRREQKEETEARTDPSLVFAPEQLEQVSTALRAHEGSRAAFVEKEHGALGMTKAQLRRALRVLDHPVRNRPPNPKAPLAYSPHLAAAMEEEGGGIEERESVEAEKRVERGTGARSEDFRFIPEAKKILTKNPNAYPEYLKWRLGVDAAQARRILNQLHYQGFLKRGDDGVLRIFPEGYDGEALEAIEQADPDDIPGFEPAESTESRSPSFLVDEPAAPTATESLPRRPRRGSRTVLTALPPTIDPVLPNVSRRPRRGRQRLMSPEEYEAQLRAEEVKKEIRRARLRAPVIPLLDAEVEVLPNPPPALPKEKGRATRHVPPPRPIASPDTATDFSPEQVLDTASEDGDRSTPIPDSGVRRRVRPGLEAEEDVEEVPLSASVAALRARITDLDRQLEATPQDGRYDAERQRLDDLKHKAFAMMEREELSRDLLVAQREADEAEEEKERVQRVLDAKFKEYEEAYEARVLLQDRLEDTQKRLEALSASLSADPAKMTPVEAVELVMLKKEASELSAQIVAQKKVEDHLGGEFDSLEKAWNDAFTAYMETADVEHVMYEELLGIDKYLAGAAIAALAFEGLEDSPEVKAAIEADRARVEKERADRAEAAQAERDAEAAYQKSGLGRLERGVKKTGNVLGGTAWLALSGLAWAAGITLKFAMDLLLHPLKTLQGVFDKFKKFAGKAMGEDTPHGKGGASAA